MRIAFLHKPSDPYAQVRIKYFVSKGHQVYSIVFHSSIKQNMTSGVTIISLPFSPLIRIPFVKRLIYFKNIRNITSQNNIDILYVISALNSVYLKASTAKSNFLEIQGSDVITGARKYPFLKSFYKTLWKYADAIIQDSQLAKEKGEPYMPSNMINATIEIGVDFNVFNSHLEKGLVRKKRNLENRQIIFHSRSIKKLYNIDIIIKSIPKVREKFPDICFIFTGDISSLSKKSKRFVKDYNLIDNIIFCGRLDHETEIKYYYSDADIVVSIPTSDSSPFSVYEAMATKTPVIVSDLPWLQGKFIPGKHLITVPAQDELYLASSIIKLLNKEVNLDLESANSIVFNKINMLLENKKLEKLFENAIEPNN